MRTRLGSFLEATRLVEPIPLKSVVPSRHPLRTALGDIDSLAASIRKSGLLEPIIVRPLDTKFELVAGHRRFEACRRIRCHEIPAIVMDLTEKEAYFLALEENLQRETLDPIDEAESFRRYVSRYGYGSETELAGRIGRSEEYVSHRIMLLSLPAETQEQVRRRLLSPSDAWEISRAKLPWLQKEIAKSAVAGGATVRQIRKVVNLVNAGTPVEDAFDHVRDRLALTQGAPDADPDRRTEKMRAAALTTLKVAMIRLDGLIGVAPRGDPRVGEELKGLRISIHNLIGSYQGGRGAEGSPPQEVSELIKGKFLSYFNSGRVRDIAKLRVPEKFTIFDDYPLGLMDLKQSLKHDFEVMRTARPMDCAVRDLNVKFFENGDGAVATFLFLQKHKKGRRTYSWESRVSFVLEKNDAEWRIVHEHWSEANPRETTMRRIQKVNALPPRPQGAQAGGRPLKR